MAVKPWYAILVVLFLTSVSLIRSRSAWAIATNVSQNKFGVTLGGEFSTAINNCGLWQVVACCLSASACLTSPPFAIVGSMVSDRLLVPPTAQSGMIGL